MHRIMAILLMLAGASLLGCQTHTTEGTPLRPDTSSIKGYHDTGVPPNMGAPMPSDWHGFKAY